MKRILLLSFIVCAIISSAKSQDYNFGFESWIDHGDYDEPEFWGTFNPVQFIGIQVIKDTVDVYEGNYSLKLSAGPIPAAVAVLGSINVNSALIEPGRPYNQRPTKMKCYYKTILVNNDSSAIAAFLTKYNTVTHQRDTIAVAGSLFYTDVTSWTLLEIDFDYNSAETPDTIGIILSSTANPDGLGNEGCELYIDAMELVVPSSGVEEQTAKNSISIFPNPAKDELKILNSGIAEKLFVHFYDITGREIYSSAFTSAFETVTVKSFAAGKYSVKIDDGEKIKFSGSFLKE